MNRYDIKQKKSGQITHSYVASTEAAHHPAWGELERIKWQEECSAEELIDAVETLDVEIYPSIPGVPAVTKTRYLLSLDPEVYKFEEECTPEEIAAAIRSEAVEIEPAVPEVPAVTKKKCRLPQTYEVVVTDISGELKAEANKKWIKEREAQADVEIQALLEGNAETTKLMLSCYDIVVATNVLGVQSADEVDAAKQRIMSSLQLMEQIQIIRAQRDQEIANHLAENPE